MDIGLTIYFPLKADPSYSDKKGKHSPPLPKRGRKKYFLNLGEKNG